MADTLYDLGLWGGPSAVPDSSWTYSMPNTGDLLRWSPDLTGEGLSRLLGLGSIGKLSLPDVTVPNLTANATSNPLTAALYTNQPGTGSGGAPPEGFWKGTSSRVLDLVKKNPAAFLALLSAGGAGLAGAVKGSDTVKLPKEVSDLARRASAPMAPDPYAEAALDRQMRRDIGPGWETSTPGIQAKEYATYLRQKGDQSAAAAALGPVGTLYANQQNTQNKQQSDLFSLAALLGTLGLGGLSDYGYSRQGGTR